LHRFKNKPPSLSPNIGWEGFINTLLPSPLPGGHDNRGTRLFQLANQLILRDSGMDRNSTIRSLTSAGVAAKLSDWDAKDIFKGLAERLITTIQWTLIQKKKKGC